MSRDLKTSVFINVCTYTYTHMCSHANTHPPPGPIISQLTHRCLRGHLMFFFRPLSCQQHSTHTSVLSLLSYTRHETVISTPRTNTILVLTNLQTHFVRKQTDWHVVVDVGNKGTNQKVFFLTNFKIPLYGKEKYMMSDWQEAEYCRLLQL